MDDAKATTVNILLTIIVLIQKYLYDIWQLLARIMMIESLTNGKTFNRRFLEKLSID
ncbi:MAG: hypothetical protein MUC60_02350 [Oscillatoria sp. Prado101]|nr:hypothetical protein [Oscillatoria sp. Prado101]